MDKEVERTQNDDPFVERHLANVKRLQKENKHKWRIMKIENALKVLVDEGWKDNSIPVSNLKAVLKDLEEEAG